MNWTQWTCTGLLFVGLLSWKAVAAAARPLGTNGATLAGYLWVSGLVVGAMWLRGIPAGDLFLGGLRPLDLPVGVALGVGLFVLGIAGYALTQALTGAELPEEARSFLAPVGVSGWSLVLGTTILAVLAEELAFRGLLLRDLEATTSPVAAVLLSAALFAAFHLSLLQVGSTFVLGCGLAWITLSAGRLAPALVAHATYNLLGIGLALVTRG